MIIQDEIQTINTLGTAMAAFTVEESVLIFKTLSTSLYRDKILAVLREVSANALDANKAAGKENEPIFVSLPTELDPNLIIRDKGTGIDLEGFELYTTFFKSSKRNDSNLTGGFGLGSKSPFSISDAFTVTSVKNGLKNSFLMIKNNGLPSKMPLIKNMPTDEPNGTEVSIPVDTEDDRKIMHSRAAYLYSYWKTKPEVVNLNYGRRIQECNLIKVEMQYSNGLYFDRGIIVGEFQYDVPKSMQDRISTEISTALESELSILRTVYGSYRSSVPSVLLFLGNSDIELSPSRETIEDTENNRNVIVSKTIETIKEYVNHNVYNAIPRLTNLFDHLKEINKCVDRNQLMSYIDSNITTEVIVAYNTAIMYYNLAKSSGNTTIDNIAKFVIDNGLLLLNTKVNSIQEFKSVFLLSLLRKKLNEISINELYINNANTVSNKHYTLPLTLRNNKILSALGMSTTAADVYVIEENSSTYVGIKQKFNAQTEHTKLDGTTVHISKSDIRSDNVIVLVINKDTISKLEEVLNFSFTKLDSTQYVTTKKPKTLTTTSKTTADNKILGSIKYTTLPITLGYITVTKFYKEVTGKVLVTTSKVYENSYLKDKLYDFINYKHFDFTLVVLANSSELSTKRFKDFSCNNSVEVIDSHWDELLPKISNIAEDFKEDKKKFAELVVLKSINTSKYEHGDFDEYMSKSTKELIDSTHRFVLARLGTKQSNLLQALGMRHEPNALNYNSHEFLTAEENQFMSLLCYSSTKMSILKTLIPSHKTLMKSILTKSIKFILGE